MNRKALFLDSKEGSIPELYLGRLKKIFGQIVYLPSGDPSLKKRLKDAEFIFGTFPTVVDKGMIDTAPKLKYIGKLSTAYEKVDTKYARTKNIAVTNLGGYSTEAVAEFTVAVVLEHLRNLEAAKKQARRRVFSFDKFMGRELAGKILGVVGAGKIGGRIAEIGHGFGMRVLYFARTNKPHLNQLGAKKVNLDKLLKESDVISLNLSQNNETKGILNSKRIKLMKKDTVIVNTAPTDLVDVSALLKRLQKGELTYILDHSDETKLELVKRFQTLENAIVYPPIAFRTEEANTNRWETFTSNIEKFIAGKSQNVVN